MVFENKYHAWKIFFRNIEGVADCYKKIVKKINADQPKADVFSQGKIISIEFFILSLYIYVLFSFFTFLFPVSSYLCSSKKSLAPHTPKVLLLGASGSGKSVQASLIARKYNIINGMKWLCTCLFVDVDRTGLCIPGLGLLVISLEREDDYAQDIKTPVNTHTNNPSQYRSILGDQYLQLCNVNPGF